MEARLSSLLGCGTCGEGLPFGAQWFESLIDQLLYVADFDPDSLVTPCEHFNDTVSNIIPCNTNISSDIVHDIVDNGSHNFGIVSNVQIASSPLSDNITPIKLCDGNDIANVSEFVNTNFDYAVCNNGDNVHDIVDTDSHNFGIVSNVSDNFIPIKLCDRNDIANISEFVNTNFDCAFYNNGDNVHDLSQFVHTNDDFHDDIDIVDLHSEFVNTNIPYDIDNIDNVAGSCSGIVRINTYCNDNGDTTNDLSRFVHTNVPYNIDNHDNCTTLYAGTVRPNIDYDIVDNGDIANVFWVC
jgi:hypothetical protein